MIIGGSSKWSGNWDGYRFIQESKMKRFVVLLGALVLAFSATSVQADETGQVSDDALAAMGLSDMEVMSDEEGEAVRGQGAIAFGGSYAFFNGLFGGSGSVNGYGGIGKTAAGGVRIRPFR